MYISKLRLHGFKSFLHKTDLEFGEGVTAVVGPNGCGKSNIVDAIRWVLGEQKTSILRSSKMEDIIFNGTKNKKPLSVCEASMLIHNNMGLLPTEYNDVEISRRLYRSGESEFYINKSLCRLKDIHKLFIDTGMSPNAYSVIELKMVDNILSNNAGDRRQMFEEAAGINNYNQQRMAALRKMKVTQTDMDRINDIILEIKNSINNLKIQVKRYERYEKLIEKQKFLKIQNACSEIQIIKNKQLPLEEKLSHLTSAQSSLSYQMNIDEILTEQVKKNYEDNKAGLNKNQIIITEVENKISTINSNLLIWAEKILGNDNQVQLFNDELEHSSTNLATVKKKISKLNDRKIKLVPEIHISKEEFKNHERKCNKVAIIFDKMQSDQELAKKETETNYLKIREEEGSRERVKRRINEKEEYKEIIVRKLNLLNRTIENTIADTNLIRAEVEKYENINNALSNELSILKSNHSKFEEGIFSLKKKQINLESKKSALKTQIKFYTSIIYNFDGHSDGVKNILSNHEEYPNVIGVLSDLIQVDEEYQAAVDVAFGEYYDCLVVDSKKNAEALIADSTYCLSIFALDSVPKIISNKSRYPATSLLSLIKCKNELKQLLKILIGDVCLLPDNNAEPHIKTMDNWKWVSKDGKYYCRGFIHKTVGRVNESIIGRKHKLNQLEKEYDDITKEINNVAKDLGNIIKTTDSAYEKMKNKSDELDAGIKVLNISEQKMIHQDFLSAHHKQQEHDIKQELKNTETQVIELNIHLNTKNKSIQACRIDYKDLTTAYNNITKEISEERSLINKEQQKLQDARIKLLEIEKEEEGLKQRIEILMSQEKEIDERIQKYNIELLRIDEENVSFNKAISNGKEELHELRHSLEMRNSDTDELEKGYNKSYEELQRLQLGIRERQKQKEEYLSKVKEYEFIILEGANEIKNHRSRIKELYNEDLSDIPIDLEKFTLAMQKKEIEKNQRSLDNIGAVNLAVNDEFEKETARYNFLNEQYTDLKESEKTIEETINKLNSEAQSKFMDTFQAIQENFIKTYTTFFDGGEGYLRLIGADNPLEAEIEIIAQPPGKKAQTLRMLSAGEKALTAIALLFSIYLVKPSPFCILDEVDAPLDDTNIGKFSKALNDFSNKTQFIVVTHNKLTMEKADYMYGITQQEEGVSKIVSVNMKETEIEEAVA